MERKLVISDIDGTLLNDKHQLTKRTIQVVRQLTEENTIVVLASARPPKAMEEIAHQLKLETPLVCFNGALITQNKAEKFDSLYSLSINYSEAILIEQLMRNHFPTIQVSVYSEEHWFVAKKDAWVHQEEAIAGISAEVVDLTEYLNGYHPIHKILCMGSEGDLQLACKKLEMSGIINVTAAFSKPNYLEIVNSQVSKLASLQFLCHYYDISLSNTVAIGDNYNDIPMIQHAGVGIAMGNAPQAVKEAAKFQTTSNSLEGFSKALENYFELDTIDEKLY